MVRPERFELEALWRRERGRLSGEWEPPAEILNEVKDPRDYGAPGEIRT